MDCANVGAGHPLRLVGETPVSDMIGYINQPRGPADYSPVWIPKVPFELL